MKNDYPEQLPLARTEQLIVKEVDDEVLVYDLKTDRAHCLNRTAGLVWKNCNGTTTIVDIAKSIESETGQTLDSHVIWLALDELRKFNLLDRLSFPPVYLAGVNRRQLMRTLGVAAIALPVIMSIAAPAAEAQGSTVTPGGCAARDKALCGGTTCTGGLTNCNRVGSSCVCN